MDDILTHVQNVSADDVLALAKAQESYGDSWKRRGGVGAFMMLARKWDRIENRVRDTWDVFEHIRDDERAEGIIDDIRDLRRYLLLVEAEMARQGVVAAKTKSRDNQ